MEKAAQFAPREPHFYAQRGSAKQSLGEQQGANRDHDTAMALGGARWIKHYQCGLRLARLYFGPLDGTLRPELGTALRICVDKGDSCSPWSNDPECPEPVGDRHDCLPEYVSATTGVPRQLPTFFMLKSAGSGQVRGPSLRPPGSYDCTPRRVKI